MRIKKGDMVIILAGKERGNTGKVLKVLPKRERVIVEGRNFISRHKKAGPQGQEGGIIRREAGIHASNVALFSEKTQRGVRVGIRFVGAEGALFKSSEEAIASFGESVPKRLRKVRFAPKTGEVFE